MKVVRIFSTHFETNGWGISEPKFIGGQYYPLEPDAQRQVDLGNGEIVDAPEDPAKAEAQAEAAQAAADKAVAKADAAAEAAEAAKAAAPQEAAPEAPAA